MGYGCVVHVGRFAVASIVAASCALGSVALADSTPAPAPLRRLDMSRAAGAGATPQAPEIRITRIPADPPAMREKTQWIFDLRWDKGDPYLLGMHKIDLPAPQLTPRVMGRFALELFEGPTLIERVRFDFPLLGADPISGAPALEKRLVTRIGVTFPATRRGTRLELWDRATGRRWALPWPPRDTRAVR